MSSQIRPKFGSAADVKTWLGVSKHELTQLRKNKYILSFKKAMTQQSKRTYDLDSIEDAMFNYMQGLTPKQNIARKFKKNKQQRSLLV